jgi:hypothetical protein
MNLTLLLVSAMAFLIAITVSAYSWNRYRTFSYVTIIWFLVTLGLAQIPYFQDPISWTDGDWKGFLVFGNLLMVPVILLILVWQKSSKFQAFLHRIPTWLLISTQVYRLAGIFFLFFYFQDKLPLEIGLVNGILDVVVAIGAVIVARVVYQKGAKANSLVLAWNGLGLLDFASAFTMVGVSFFGVMNIFPAPTLMAMPPLTLISIFQVPLAMFIHIYLIARIRKN